VGEPVRIWYSHQPDEMCGLYWFMDQLYQRSVNDARICMVRLPEWETDDKENMIQRISWSDVSPGDWHRYLRLQESVTPVFMKGCAYHWQELKSENAPLRAVINSQLVSVSENLYDYFILCEISAVSDEFQEVMVIGRVLGKYQLGISDFWIAHRIEEMIQSGTLEVISEATDDMPRYHRMLKKCKQ